MFTPEDKEFMNNPAYSLPLEKFYNGSYYREKNGKNGSVTQAYSFSNERLHNVFSHIKKNFKKVLTVGSSGDQLFYCIYYGATDIYVFDANLFAQPWIEYKISAIKNLSFEDFVKYFVNMDCKNHNNPFVSEIYTKIFQDFSIASQAFWGQIFMNGYSTEEIYSSILSRRDASSDRIFSIFYKDKQAYNKLQKILQNGEFSIHFVNEEFSNFSSTIKDKFDLILLSNIKRYVNEVTFIKTVNDLFENNLNNGGTIQLHYEYFNPMGRVPKSFQSLFNDKKILGYGFKDKHFTYLLRKSSFNKQIEELNIAE